MIALSNGSFSNEVATDSIVLLKDNNWPVNVLSMTR